MIKLNLLPIREEQKRNKLIQQFIFFVVVIILIFAANIVFYTLHSDAFDTQKIVVSKLQQDVDKYKNLLGDLKKEKDKKTEFLQRIDAINSLESLRQNLLRVLDELNKQIPHKTWLTELKKQGTQLILTGGASSFEDVSTFAHSLKGESKYFKRVDIKNVQLEDIKDKSTNVVGTPRIVLFEIVCTLQ
ncbi:PilN domain-containing protein [bacterium]|nr:PilN domain-containing protein [bacterium]